jgi:hypothetical protein
MAKEINTTEDSAPPEFDLLALERKDMLKPVPPDRNVLPGIPAEAYTLLAGPLSAYKSMLLLYLAIWKATGWDLLGLGPEGVPVAPGPAVVVFYEDVQWRVKGRFNRILQYWYYKLARKHGEKSAEKFLDCAAANIRLIPLTGKADCTLVQRAAGEIVPNTPMIEELLTKVRAFAASDVLLCLDPLRLAIKGSQSDDDGADVVVHVFNRIAYSIPGCGLVVSSHTTKGQAADPGDGYVAASYATAGSALYSQHARSNFWLIRVAEKDLRNLFSMEELPPEEHARQPVARLMHGRLSHGAESALAYVRMTADGVLVPIKALGTAQHAKSQMDRALVLVVDAIDALATQQVSRISQTVIIAQLQGALGGKSATRDMLALLEGQGFLGFEGKTKDRTGRVTETGRKRAGELRAERGEPDIDA